MLERVQNVTSSVTRRDHKTHKENLREMRRDTCRETHGSARRRQNAPAGAGHKDKTPQTEAAARKALFRKTCSISDGLPRARERCRRRSAGLASGPRRRHPSLALLGGKRYQATGVRHRQILPARSRPRPGPAAPGENGGFTSRRRRPRGPARYDRGARVRPGSGRPWLPLAGTAPLQRGEQPAGAAVPAPRFVRGALGSGRAVLPPAPDLPPRRQPGALPPAALPAGPRRGGGRGAAPPWARSTRSTRQRRRNGARPPPPRTAVRTEGGAERGDPSVRPGARLPSCRLATAGGTRPPLAGWAAAQRLRGAARVWVRERPEAARAPGTGRPGGAQGACGGERVVPGRRREAAASAGRRLGRGVRVAERALGRCWGFV